MSMTIPNAIDYWAVDAPDRLAIAYEDVSATYGELKHWTDNVAADLLARGIRGGERVGIFAGNSLNWCVTALAIIKCGAIVVPFNYRYTLSEITSVTTDCTPTLVVIEAQPDERVEALRAVGVPLLSIGVIEAARSAPPVDFSLALDPEAPVAIAYTSGSTAQPKGVVYSHRTMLAHSLEALWTDPEWVAGKKILGASPLYTGAGLSTLVKYTTLGLQTFLLYTFDAATAFRILVENQIDSFGGVPTFFERIAALPGFTETDLSHIKYASVSGARVPVALLRTWLERGVVLRQAYGLTESGGNTTIMDREGALHSPEKCGPGRPFTKHRVVNAQFEDCAPGDAGEILLQGPTIMAGYWNKPEATAEVFVDGWLRTGDIGMLDEHRNLTVIDRMKDIIISGGLNIASLDIESVIAQLDGVEDVAVIGVPDARFGETPLAIIHASTPLETADVIAQCNLHLSNYKVPRYVVFAPEPLPRLATGKIAKKLLKDRYQEAAEEMERVR